MGYLFSWLLRLVVDQASISSCEDGVLPYSDMLFLVFFVKGDSLASITLPINRFFFGAIICGFGFVMVDLVIVKVDVALRSR